MGLKLQLSLCDQSKARVPDCRFIVPFNAKNMVVISKEDSKEEGGIIYCD